MTDADDPGAGFTPRPCPLCARAGHSRALFAFTVREILDATPFYDDALRARLRLAPDAVFRVDRCDCGFVFAPLAPSPEFLERLYGADPQAPQDDDAAAAAARPEWAGHLLRILGEALERTAVRIARRPLRVLDVGCGFGVQLCALSRPGFPYRCTGVEPNPRAAAFLHAAGVPVQPSLQALVAGAPEPFDLVILNEVLEHVVEPAALLRDVAPLMTPRSLLWIGVPDFGDVRIAAIERGVARGDPPPRDLNPWEHLSYFSPRTLDAMTARCGLRRVPGPERLELDPRARGLRALHALARLNVHALRLLRGRRARPEGFYERAG